MYSGTNEACASLVGDTVELRQPGKPCGSAASVILRFAQIEQPEEIKAEKQEIDRGYE